MKFLCTHKLHTNLPNSSHELVHKSNNRLLLLHKGMHGYFNLQYGLNHYMIINLQLEKNACFSHVKLLLHDFNSELAGFLFEPKIVVKLLYLSQCWGLQKMLKQYINAHKQTSNHWKLQQLIDESYLLKIHFWWTCSYFLISGFQYLKGTYKRFINW